MTLCPDCARLVAVHDGTIMRHRANGEICTMSDQPVWCWTEQITRNAVANRSGSVCEYCAAARATECHHRIPRSVGGDWSPANIVHLCHDCHDWVTNNPTAARRVGLHLHSEENPQAIPLTRASGHLVLLSDDLLPPRRRAR